MRQTEKRGGFTLIELTVVILIILILMGLITGAILKYMDEAPKLQTVNELNQLTAACEAFKLKYKMYPPSSFLLSNKASDYTGTGYDTYLYALWPRINTLNWAPASGNVLLEGDQCLVFFLAGPNLTGWSTDGTNPTLTTGPRVGPFFEFPTGRLKALAHGQTGQAANAFLSFMDSYSIPTKGQPYGFFSSGRSAGGYNQAKLAFGTPSIGGDCPSLGVQPFVQSTGRFYNPNSVQIISAGKDFSFGPGGSFTAGSGSYADGAVGFDDFSNFWNGLLGVP
jgi:prepilin-type N-terminal cleavage/methylation domain-containing protein